MSIQLSFTGYKKMDQARIYHSFFEKFLCQYCRTEISSTSVGAITIIDNVELSPRYDIFMMSIQYNLH
jgi:hypothetical protein